MTLLKGESASQWQPFQDCELQTKTALKLKNKQTIKDKYYVLIIISVKTLGKFNQFNLVYLVWQVSRLHHSSPSII